MQGVVNTEDDVVGRRIVAALVDSVLVFAILYAGIVTVGGLGLGNRATLAPAVVIGFYLWYVFAVLGFAPLLLLHDYSGIWFAIGVGLWVGYGAVFEAILGATPGKLLTGIVVVGEDGTSGSLSGVFARNLFRVVDAIGFYFLGFLVLSFSPRRKRLGDVVGGTIVVRRAKQPTDTTVSSSEPGRVETN